VILVDETPVAELVHAGGNTTNNKMELHALIMTFPHLPHDEPVILFTDSQYVQKGLTEWTKGWVKRGWLTASGGRVKNREQWQELLRLAGEYPNVEVRWVKAHNGDRWNERADELANVGTARSRDL
jgi:ribonuclease HI